MYHMVDKIRKQGVYYTVYAAQIMRSPIVKDFFVYSFGSLLVRSATILIAPITLTLLNPHEFGILALAMSFINILAVFLGFGLRQVVSLEFFHADSHERRQLVNDVIIIYLMLACPIFLLLCFLSSSINRYIFVSSVRVDFIVLGLAISFISFFVEFFYQILRYQCKSWYIMQVQLGVALFSICTNLFMLCVLRWGIYAMMISNCASMLLAMIIALHVYYAKGCFASLHVRRSFARITYYLKYGAPFIPTVLFGWFLASADRWILAHYASMHDVGIYSLADTFGQLYNLLILYPLSGSYLPHLFNRYARNKMDLIAVDRWNLRNMGICMIAASLLITSGYGLCCSLLHLLLPVRYHEAIAYIWLVLMGYVFLMGTYFATAFIQYQKKTGMLLLSISIPAVLNILLNLLLVPHFGIGGCVSATLVSYIVYFTIVVWCNFKLKK